MSRKIKILQYNIRARPRYITPWDKVVYRCQEFLKFLENEINNLDLIVLQEVFDSRARNLLKDYFVDKDWHIFGSTQVMIISGGIFIASKFKFISVLEEKFINCSLQDCLASKGMCYAKIKVTDFFNYNVIGTHLQDGDTDLGNTRRYQISQMREFIEKVNNEKTEPFYVIGDFNICNNLEPELFEYLKQQISSNIILPYVETEISNLNLDYIISVNTGIFYKSRICGLLTEKGIPVSDHNMIFTTIYF
jgi:exonuclease III